ncbi:MAG: sensor histidine kinase [Leptolyngbyaceae cyanobacterium CSU_1_3]|nr:sensor histidine kinase [Leptolyngbyaceae cyanobacterium CSU_1_3]
MTKPSHSSFRRILLSRLLLLSIPVLLAGEIVAYRKARSGLLETARHNLAEAAIRRGGDLASTIAALRTNLLTATEASALQSSSPKKRQRFLEQLQQNSAIATQCVQLTNLQTQKIEASTCGNRSLLPPGANFWANQPQGQLANPKQVHLALTDGLRTAITPDDNQLNLILSAPVYLAAPGTAKPGDPATLRYALTMQTDLYQQEASQGKLIPGHTVIIDQDGQILAHPIADRVGRTIQAGADAERLQSLIKSAIAGNQDTLHLFSFEKDGAEWLAGYSPMEIAINPSESRTWVILAATPLEYALYSLQEIRQVLLILTVGLVTAILLATLYLSRELALPIEQLSDYALQIRQRYSSDRAPKNFKVKELNHLAEALDNMVDRLEERAEELESAWQEAQAANQLKSDFLATTSHELRTPLNAIIGCVRLIQDGCCDDREEELEFLQQADDAAIHLLKIINDLLDIAKIEAGKVELNLQPIQIKELCRQCMKMVQPGAEMKRLKLNMEVDQRIDSVLVDERRVRQMVINLLSNAVKFTPEGGQVKLAIGLGFGQQLEQDTRPDRSPINPNTPYLRVAVQDSGIGIPEDRWHLLFRPFQQVDSSLTRKHEGTGLGLALTKRLAELHGGTLSFTSTIGQGSTFRIWLPLLEPSTDLLPSIDTLELLPTTSRVSDLEIDRLSIPNS